jgi:hypothetical protein
MATRVVAKATRPRGGVAGAPIRVGLLGFGTIGTGVVKLLRAHRAEIAVTAIDVVAAIADLDKTDPGCRNPRRSDPTRAPCCAIRRSTW